MKQFFLVFATFFSISSYAMSSDQFLEQEQKDSSIISVDGNKFYLDGERISIDENGIYLSSEFFGLISLQNLMQDSKGIYTTGWYYYYECNNCGYRYRKQPRKCDNCGGSSFSLIN